MQLDDEIRAVNDQKKMPDRIETIDSPRKQFSKNPLNPGLGSKTRVRI